MSSANLVLIMNRHKPQANIIETCKERVLILDGAMGTTLHAQNLSLDDYDGHENCNEILVATRPDVVRGVHASFLEAGSDAVLTNTFGGSNLVLRDFGLDSRTRELNRLAATIARGVCDEYTTIRKPRFAIGSMGPGSRLPSLGQVSWHALSESYTEQVYGLVEGGVDALLIETCQDILQSKCAIVACIDAMETCGVDLPIFCTVTVETTGTMLVGTDTLAALVTLDAYPQVKAIGINCATGPKEMSEHIRLLSRHSVRPIIVQPNAGMPELINGQTVFPLSDEEFANWLEEFVKEDGVSIVGGCCGTTPAHIQAVANRLENQAPKQRSPLLEASCSSIYQAVTLRQDNSVLAIGERTNANGSKRFRELLAADDIDGMVQVGRELVKSGSHVLDVCTAYVGRNEADDMRKIVSRFAADITAPLMIDSTESAALEAALQVAGGKCIVNSINLEEGEERLDAVCRLARRYGAALVALTIDEEGMAKTAEHKCAVAERIYDLVVNRHGVRPSDLIFDTLTFTLATGKEDDRRLALESMKAISMIKERFPQVHMLLGLSNVSFGLLPAGRKILNSAFLHYSREAGLDCAIVHPSHIVPLYRIDEEQRRTAEDLVFDRREGGYDPLTKFIELFSVPKETSETESEKPKKVEDRLKLRIIEGDRVNMDDDLTLAMSTAPPLEIINDFLLDGMKTVGDLFGAGQMQLPFVLQSAETMKAAVSFLQPFMDKTETETKGRIVIATVRGDVHDIGKNLVDIILTNNGYEVYNLGIKQPISTIADAWEEHQADAIGMSGLLVKSTVVMRENVAVLKERGVTTPIILGGAALTRKFVEEEIAPLYAGPVFYARDAFEGLHIMDRIASGRTEPVGKKVTKQPAQRRINSETSLPTPARSAIARNNPIPKPPFWGTRRVEHVTLRDILVYLNERMLFNIQWQYHKQGLAGAEYEQFIEDEVRPIYNELVDDCEANDILTPKAIYGYWPCMSDGDSLLIFDPEDHSREIICFDFPRQRKDPFWCLSDFFRPVDSGEMDVVAFTVVTIGHTASRTERQLFKEDRYRDYLHLHGLSVEAAEAFAEYLHKHIRNELRIADKDATDVDLLLRQKYQGSRYSFGYPACPRLEDQLKLWPLLKPEQIGVSISDEFQLEPEQTTTAMVCHHPEAKYFNVR